MNLNENDIKMILVYLSSTLFDVSLINRDVTVHQSKVVSANGLLSRLNISR